MGWNAGYKIVEQQVINLYNANKSELAVMNYWYDVKEHFPTKEAYDHASRIHDDFNDIKFEALTKATGW